MIHGGHPRLNLHRGALHSWKFSCRDSLMQGNHQFILSGFRFERLNQCQVVPILLTVDETLRPSSIFHLKGDCALCEWGALVILHSKLEHPLTRHREDDPTRMPLLIRILQTRSVSLCTVGDRKSTRLNSSHVAISYAVCCLKKKIRSDA